MAALLAAMLASDRWVRGAHCPARLARLHPKTWVHPDPRDQPLMLLSTALPRLPPSPPCRGGNIRPLRRLLLTRCEKAFELTPPPGEGRAQGRRADEGTGGGKGAQGGGAGSLAGTRPRIPADCLPPIPDGIR